MSKFLMILLLSVQITNNLANAMTENELLIENMKQVPRSYGEAVANAFSTLAISWLMAADNRRREALEEQYIAQQIAYEEMLQREEDERQRQIALHYYIHSKHRKPTKAEIKTADDISDDLNKN